MSGPGRSGLCKRPPIRRSRAAKIRIGRTTQQYAALTSRACTALSTRITPIKSAETAVTNKDN
jgi:hypothetical protein